MRCMNKIYEDSPPYAGGGGIGFKMCPESAVAVDSGHFFNGPFAQCIILNGFS